MDISPACDALDKPHTRCSTSEGGTGKTHLVGKWCLDHPPGPKQKILEADFKII